MRFANDQVAAEYADYVKKNSQDGYSQGVVDYTERWVALLEAGIPEDASVEAAIGILVRGDFAKNTSHEADTEGITGFMYGCAVQALAHFWKHGEALRRWHNKDVQIKDEGDRANESGGVLNPAILSIG